MDVQADVVRVEHPLHSRELAGFLGFDLRFRQIFTLLKVPRCKILAIVV